MNETVVFLKNLKNTSQKTVIVGCSGGPDSMCLLAILGNMNFDIVCAHVNHNIRKESKDEYEFLRDYCRKKDILFEGLEIPPYKDKNESFYRTKRYDFYKELCNKYDTDTIMTAHHGDDLIETILMRLVRGSRLRGYTGFPISYKEGSFEIIKPLIFCTKDEILEYDKKNRVPFVLDKTNDEDTYTRNRYRHTVLPFLKKEDKNVHKKFLSYSRELAKACDYIDSIVAKSIAENYKENSIDLAKFMSLDRFIKQKELETILKSIYKDDIDKIKSRQIENIIDLIEKGKNFTLNLPLKVKIVREYDKLKIEKTTHEQEDYEFVLESSLTLENGDTIEYVTSSDDSSNYTTRLATIDLKLPLIVRSRRDGDVMRIKNMKGSKKIKSIMIDEKVPLSKRITYPIVTDREGTIVWLPGLRKSKFDSEINEKYDIILRYTKKGEKIDEEK